MPLLFVPAKMCPLSFIARERTPNRVNPLLTSVQLSPLFLEINTPIVPAKMCPLSLVIRVETYS